VEGDLVRAGQAEAIFGQDEVGRNEAVGALFVIGDEGNELGLALADLGDLGPGFAVAVDLVAGNFRREEALMLVEFFQEGDQGGRVGGRAGIGRQLIDVRVYFSSGASFLTAPAGLPKPAVGGLELTIQAEQK